MRLEKSSFTAYVVVLSLSKLASIPRWQHYFSKETITLLNAFSRYGRDSLAKWAVSAIPATLISKLMNIVFIPGMANHYLFRKIFIEEHTIKAIKQGAKQVIVIGSGFDFLAIRLSKHYPDVIFFEIDRPNTLSVKQTILCRINWHVPTNCLAIPIDLNKQDPASTLGEYKQFNVNAPTLVIMEGVLMYLFESEVKRLFCALRSLSEEKLSLIFGATVSCDDSARGPISLINTLLRRAGEGTNWHCPRAVIAQFLNNLGYQLVETITYKQLQRRFLSESEIINVPEEDENYYIAVAKDLAAVAPHVKN